MWTTKAFVSWILHTVSFLPQHTSLFMSNFLDIYLILICFHLAITSRLQEMSHHTLCNTYILYTFVISTSLISKNRLSRSENLVPVLTWKSNTDKKKYCGKEEKLLLRSNFSSFPQYFQYICYFRRQITYSFVKYRCSIYRFLLF